MKKARKQQLITLFLLIIFLGSTFAMFQPEETKQEVWKVKLDIVINGDLYQIPPEVGITGETKAKLYTQEADNIIYKEGQEDVRLKDFFEIWGENFNSTCIFDYCNNGNHSMKMYVWENDKWVQNSEYELYIMKRNDYIKIDYR